MSFFNTFYYPNIVQNVDTNFYIFYAYIKLLFAVEHNFRSVNAQGIEVDRGGDKEDFIQVIAL